MSDKEIKETDLGRAYYKLNLYKIGAIIACTITVCSSGYGGLWWLKSVLQSHSDSINAQEQKIQDLSKKTEDIQNQQIKSIWSQIENLQDEINTHIENDNDNRSGSRK